ncbi:unnamed protein product [Ilex paraguariensis]|uniref:Uncharacterized protein n=1 Tax=Ilex paraguariensis TaxID=185542 RepID=A0ABC8QPK7_9AQUA
MLPLQSLLNPASPKSSPRCSYQPTPALVSASATVRPAASRSRMDARKPVRRSGRSLLKSRTQGPVRFPPFEDVSAQAMQEIATYQISAFGQIQQCSEHIPYNSTKKNFYEKTGREGIEAKKSPQLSSTSSGSQDNKPSSRSCGTTTLASSA